MTDLHKEHVDQITIPSKEGTYGTAIDNTMSVCQKRRLHDYMYDSTELKKSTQHKAQNFRNFNISMAENLKKFTHFTKNHKFFLFSFVSPTFCCSSKVFLGIAADFILFLIF